MILRRPYKFLIKYFKPIHIIMFGIFIYFAFVLRKINVFFSNYVKSGNFIYVENMVKEYVTWYAFLLILLVIVGTIFFFILMKKKNKPVLYYRILIVYSVILLGVLIYFYMFFVNTKELTYEPLEIVINRDISTFMYIINYFYVGFSFIRGFGFDIKKFNFEQDKKEFEIEETDNEEFEVNVEVDKKDVNAKLRHTTREFGYIIRENSKTLIFLGTIILFFLAGYLYVNFFVINKVYKANENVVIGNISYKVTKSYLTNYDKYGNKLSNNFVLINVNVNNNGDDVKFTREKFRIKISDRYYYPVYNYYNMFDDLGNYYDNNSVIKKKSNENYLLIFNVGNNKQEKIYLEILKNRKSLYELIVFKPIFAQENNYNYSIGDELKINSTILKISDFDIINKTSFTYEECKNGTCNTYTKTVGCSNTDWIKLKS